MRVEILSGVERRRRWSADEKTRILEEVLVPGVKVSDVARQHGLSPSLLFTWRRLAREGELSSDVPTLVPVEIEMLQAPSRSASAPTNPQVAQRRGTIGLIEIELGHGRRLRVGRDVDGDALRRVLDVLERR
jgi:transposase